MTIQPGTDIGRYHILEQLGMGGMAVVYKAYDTRLENEVAVKFIRMENILPGALDRALKRFQIEAKKMAMLQHPNIVKVTDFGEYEGVPYLVMEYIPSGTLKALLGEPIPSAQAAQMLLPVAKALAYAHGRGLVHRDVKPGNILISETGEPILTDFGIAKILVSEETIDLTTTGMGVGTPEYMAPEQAEGKPIDERADIYSLGIVFYEMVTGRKPFTADTPMAVVVKQLRDPLPRPTQFVANIPQEVEWVLFKALAKDPHDRYADMGVFVEELKGLAAGGSKRDGNKRKEFTASMQARTSQEKQGGSTKPAKRNWVWLAGLMAAVMIFGVWYFGFRTPAPDGSNKSENMGTETATITPIKTPISSLGSQSDGDISLPIYDTASIQSLCASDAYGCAKIGIGQTIKIGMSSPMTGPYADFGIDGENSGLIAVADAGDLDGWAFELITEDDGGNAEGGAAAANKLTSDPTFVAMAGPIFSGAAAAAMPIYEAAGIPMMSPSATTPFLTQEGYSVFNRLPFTDPMQGAAAAAYMYNTLGFRKIAVLHDGEEYGEGLASAVKQEFEALGGTVTYFTGITAGEADYTPILTTIAADASQAVYFGGYSQEGAVLTNQMKVTGLEDAIFFGGDGIFGTDYLNRTGKNGEGSFHATPYVSDFDSAAKDKFDQDYESSYGIQPGILSPYSWNNYDSTMVLISMVKNVSVHGRDGALYIPRGALVAAVRNLTDYVGISGKYTCNQIGECNMQGPQFMTVVNGEFVVAE